MDFVPDQFSTMAGDESPVRLRPPRGFLRGCFRSRWRGLWLMVLAGIHVSAFAAVPGERMEWRTGLSEIDEGWVEHDGDDMAWSRPDFDDSVWQGANLEDLGPAEPGWHWYRLHLSLGPDHSKVRLLLAAGDGSY